jgi:hypothetical protein
MRKSLKLEVVELNRYNIMFVVAAIMLSSIGLIAVTAAECCDVKCVWEPCGTKVQQSDVDAVYALKPIKAMWAYQDADSDGKFDDNDVLYIDTVVDKFNGNWDVEEGDVRLTNYHEVPANTKVNSTSMDRGKPLKELPGGQMVVGFVDVNNDNPPHYDKYDPLYVDTDNSSTVTPNDVRLTVRTVGIMTYPCWSRVQSDDWDVNNDLLDPVTYQTEITTNSVTLLGYIDSDCDCHWSCPDKLYLQQLTGTIADKFVTIGDHRLYIPPEAIAEEDWPNCCTKVQQCDKDAVYVLTKDETIRIMFGDVNSNGIYDHGEAIYLDMVDNGDDKVEAGDIRLTWFHEEPPNYKITSLDPDRNDPLVELCGGGEAGQAVIGFVDNNSDGVYDKYDPLYIDTDCSSDVTTGDIRLTQRTLMETTYICWTMVENGDFDQILKEDLLDPVTYGTVLETPIWFMLGYIDSDCSGDWTCPDKLYLQQIVSSDGNSTADWVVTIGDHRLYIPQEAINEHCWPECCTKVQQCDVDAVYVLTKDDQIRIMYGDVNSNGDYDIGETLYIDMVDNGQDKVEAGDVRLTWYHDMYPPNTKVNSTNIDKNNPLEELCESQAVVGFVDLNNNEVYDKHDPLYVDTDCNSRVSVGDVRLTQRMASGRTYEPYTLVDQGDYDLIGETDLRDPVAPYGTHLETEIWELLGYIDSDCSGDWTCPDKLYLQQIVDIQDVKADDVVSIGDLRLYIPPEEIGPVDDDDPCVIYDTNGVAGIQLDEAIDAVNDYFDGKINLATAIDVVNCFFG